MADVHEHRDRLNHLSHLIIGAALEVHREIGPGMLESAYEACLAFELSRRRLGFENKSRYRSSTKVFGSGAVFDWICSSRT